MPTVNYQRPALYRKQFAAIFSSHRYAIIEASTKSGKTAGCIAWLTEQALAGHRGWNYWWVAPVYPQAAIAFRRLKYALAQEQFEPNEGRLTITLFNGTTIWFKGADKPDTLYGEDVYAAVIDEATRCKEDAWHAIRSTLTATEGPVRIIGNVKGRKNWAYRLARRAEAGDPAMHYAKLTAHDAVQAGVLTAEEVEDARHILPDAVFRELYLAEPSDDAGNPFGLQAIQRCLVAGLSDRPPVVWGWDLAKSENYSVGIALDAGGTVCQFHRFQNPLELTRQKIAQLCQGLPTWLDATGMGDAVVEGLQRTGSNFYGFKFSAPSKQQLMERLALAIQGQNIRYPDNEIANELRAFEYQYTRTGVAYSAPEGMYDDCVCALGLAVYGMGQHTKTVIQEFDDHVVSDFHRESYFKGHF